MTERPILPIDKRIECGSSVSCVWFVESSRRIFLTSEIKIFEFITTANVSSYVNIYIYIYILYIMYLLYMIYIYMIYIYIHIFVMYMNLGIWSFLLENFAGYSYLKILLAKRKSSCNPTSRSRGQLVRQYSPILYL